MPTYCLTISYDGTRFKGWQIQKAHGRLSARTVQAEVQKVVEKLPGFVDKIYGASRTDAGVHARGQVVSFSLSKNIPLLEIFNRLTAVLPGDIAPRSVKKVSDTFHARYSAKRKEYIYSICNSKNRPVLNRNYVWWRNGVIDIRQMQKAAKYFLGLHDFRLFKGGNARSKNTYCRIYKFTISKKDSIIICRITGDRFLYNMVRIMVGSLIKVCRGKIKPIHIKQALRTSFKLPAGSKAPAHGLLLNKVMY